MVQAYSLAKPKIPPQQCTTDYDQQKDDDYDYSDSPPFPVHVSPPLECANWIRSNIILIPIPATERRNVSEYY
jgi:hypothetical protein